MALGARMKTRLHTVFTDFAENTSCHGLGSISRSKNIFIKILWTCIFLAAFGYMISQLIGLFNKYSASPMTTEIEVKTSALNFPSVTVCNINPVRLSKVDGYIDCSANKELCELRDTMVKLQLFPNYTVPAAKRKKRSVRRVKRNVEEDPGYYNESYWDNWDPYDYYYDGDDDYDPIATAFGSYDEDQRVKSKVQEAILKLPSATYKSIGHELQTMIMKCTFLGRECNDTFFQDYTSSQFGNCFTFNGDEIVNTPYVLKRSGLGYGLQLVMNIEASEYLPKYTKGYGMVAVIHDHQTYPFPSQQGRTLPVGYESTIGLIVKNVRRLGPPFGICDKGQDFLEQYNKKYTYQACEQTCIHQFVLLECDCYRRGAREYYPHKNNTIKPCTTSEHTKCYQRIQKEMKKQNETYACTCDQPCGETEYLEFSSANQWPAKGYEETLWQDICKTDYQFLSTYEIEQCARIKDPTESINETATNVARDNYLALNVYFKALNYESIKQLPAYTLDSFLADIGGTLGLYAGISALTGGEFLFLLFHIVQAIVLSFTESDVQPADYQMKEKSSSRPSLASSYKTDITRVV